jgi:hypothetical protein
MKPTKPLQSLPRMIAAGVLMLAVLTAGCAANWGSIRYSPEATQIFKTYQVLPDHRYYYTGRDSMPDAVIESTTGIRLLPESARCRSGYGKI